MLVVDPRPGGATSNCAADNIALLNLAVSRLPAPFRRRLLVRLDGAGFSHDLLEHIAAGGSKKGQQWEFSVAWSCTDKEMNAIGALPAGAPTAGIKQNGATVPDTFVADLTGLLDLDGWHTKIPGLRVIVRDEPGHPRYRKRASEREKQLGRRYQLIATDTRHWQIAWRGTRHRCHVHVENDVKQAKDLGLNGGPPATGRSTSPGRRSSPWPRTCSPASATWPYPRVNYATRPRNCCATGCCTCPPA